MKPVVKIVFGVWSSFLTGLVAVGVLLLLIFSEGSVQPYGRNNWDNTETASPALSKGLHFTQEIYLNSELIRNGSLLEVFFTNNGVNCVGQIEIKLEQGETVQRIGSRTEKIEERSGIKIDLSGFDPGVLRIHFLGIEGGKESSPSLLCNTVGIIRKLQGTEINEPLEAHVFLYWEFNGLEKIAAYFPIKWVRFLGLIPFVGLISLGWFGLGKMFARNWK